MQWLSDFSEWLASSVRGDPAGWIAVVLVVVTAVIAYVRRRRLGELVRNLLARREVRARFRSAESTVNVMFAALLSDPQRDVAYMTGNRLGGTFRYTLTNLGPVDIEHVRVQPLSAQLETLTPLYWARIAAGSWEEFVIRVPWAAEHDVRLRWSQGKRLYERVRTLPFDAPGGGT
jgi:hypothetical protein